MQNRFSDKVNEMTWDFKVFIMEIANQQEYIIRYLEMICIYSGLGFKLVSIKV